MSIKKKHTDIPAFTPDQIPRLNRELKDLWDAINAVQANVGTVAYPVDETDTDTTKNKLVSNNLAKGWEDNKHARQHALNSTDDHTSSIVVNHIMIADANGLPADSGKTTADLGVTWVTAPTDPTDSGNEHELAEDDDYLYVCVAANTWKRVPLSTWSTGSGTSGELVGLGLLTYA